MKIETPLRNWESKVDKILQTHSFHLTADILELYSSEAGGVLAMLTMLAMLIIVYCQQSFPRKVTQLSSIMTDLFLD